MNITIHPKPAYKLRKSAECRTTVPRIAACLARPARRIVLISCAQLLLLRLSVAQIVGPPVLSSPPNGAINQSTTLVLRWDTAFGASGYDVQVSSSSLFDSLVVSASGVSSTSLQIGPLSRATTYYWRVRSSSLVGSSSWSSTWSFSTIPVPPVVPTLVSPINGAASQPLTLTVSWNADQAATSYRLQVSSSSSFSSTIVDDSTLTSPSGNTGPMANGTTYYWRVSATNAGGTSAFSAPWSFTTIPAAPGSPTLSSPANGATGIATSPMLSWGSSVGARSYRLQVSNAPSFATMVLNDSALTSTSMAIGPLANGTTYYWRVNASNDGGTSSFSTPWNFTTVAASLPSPSLVSPANGASDQATTLSLQWNAVSNASSYHLQVSTVASFASTVVDDSTITTLSRSVGPLMDGTTYYWRVSALNSSGHSPYSATWSFSTLPVAPGVPTLSSPANGTSNVPTSTTLRWNTSVGAGSYRVQVSLNSSFPTTIIDDPAVPGTSKAIGPLSAGTIYWWRVSATNSRGSSPFSAAWSFTTSQVTPDVPSLTSPPNGGKNQPLNPILSWSAATGASSYRVQVSTNGSFTSTLYLDTTITATSKQIGPLSSKTSYYWRVSAIGSGGQSPWSSTWGFETISVTPGAPILRFPTNDSVGIMLAVTLQWDTVGGATGYRLQVSADPGLVTTLVDKDSLGTTRYSLNGLTRNTKYYWRVNASNEGGPGVWSDLWCFTTVPNEPTAPVLTSPPNGAGSVSLSPTISWNSVSGAASYRLQVSTVQSFGSTLVDQSLSGTSFSPSGMSANTTYYWRVNASNAGGSSVWSAVWSFTTTVNAPSSPTLVSPANGTTGVGQSPTLAWNAVAGATSYHLQVSTSSGFSSLVLDQNSVTGTSASAGGLSTSTTYYWRVSASNSGGSSSWSAPWNFTTSGAKPLPPTTQSPVNGAINVSTTTTMNWSTSAVASVYRIQVARDTAFTSTIIDQNNLSTNSYAAGGLANNTTYYWRVCAGNTAGSSDWSLTSRFTTVPSAPAAPSPASPSDGSSNQPTAITLVWNGVAGASSYALQVSADNIFSSPVINDTNLSQTSRQVGPLSNNTRYYWHVRSANAGGLSGWSGTWSFVTQPQSQGGPSLISPANGSINQQPIVTLRWNALSGTSSYELQVSTSPGFNSTVYDNASLTQTSQQVGPLSNGVAYYWRVRATYLLFVGDWSDTWTFSIIPAAPARPTLLAPADGSSNQPLTLAISWNPVVGASTYRIQVSPNSSFTTTVVDDSMLTVSSRQIGPLSERTTYFWRVSAGDAGSWSAWSDTWRFSTTAAGLAAPTLLAPSNASVNQPQTLTLNWNPVSGATSYELQVSNNAFFSVSIIDDSTIVGTTRQVGPLPGAVTYYWRVRASNASGWGSYSTAWSFTTQQGNPTSLTLNATTTFPTYGKASDFKDTDYRIVGLPGGSALTFSAMIPGNPGDDWLAFWDYGTPDNYFLRYDGSSTFTFAVGRAFWLIKRGSWNISATVQPAPLNSLREAMIPVHSGWNLITNPFTAPLPWSTIQTLNKTTEPLYAFDGSFHISTSLAPYAGYYFFNAAHIDSLRIPYAETPQFPKGSSPDQLSDSSGWRVGISLVAGRWNDRLLWFGVSSLISSGWNKYDVHKPRAIGSAPFTCFRRPEWDPSFSLFASDIRPSAAHTERWTFEVCAPTDQSMALSFEGIENIPSDLAVYLFDESTGTYANMRDLNHYAFATFNATSKFSVFVGKENDIRGQLVTLSRPVDYLLGANYPNPFNPMTNIPVNVQVRTTFTLKVFSALGQEIRTLYSGSLDPGNHRFTWDGRDETGRPVASGVYFYRLSAPGGLVLTKSMILMK